MMEDRNTNCPKPCPRCCPCPTLLDIANSIAHEEDALACILNAECAKINKVVSTYSDVETLIAIDTSVQATLERITALEGVLKAKLDSILPLLSDCD
ncbi:hypothetical protein [Lacrimispora sp. 210928-DFI.3.58]|uniref:hypothetical protein n=1 Tax=Lacrimispora sp. 210928-DFI.3.58 TaxID=2883214 RepID=UPI001D06E867|nr:hypothetical protein [Lacrimispora sp. 210928-DFI.3.58]MCB7318432.1 hypothetical protein [Lacrimispora sp. 210928-DFI.3.58]